MQDSNNNITFSEQDLIRFTTAQNNVLKKVVCILWQNSTNENDIVELIDRVEFTFENGTSLKIACNNEGTGLMTTEEDAKLIAAELKKEFNGKIKIFKVDASSTAMWKDIIDKKLDMVQLTKENEAYKSDSLLLNFGPETRIISVHPLDGLIIDFYEPD
ncbi:MAG: hypothetical protein IPM51_02315 [Sphingobacteriaceae bacterium]|nr:hypothetical protein [Sphingobacteriaceae bacterium]